MAEQKALGSKGWKAPNNLWQYTDETVNFVDAAAGYKAEMGPAGPDRFKFDVPLKSPGRPVYDGSDIKFGIGWTPSGEAIVAQNIVFQILYAFVRPDMGDNPFTLLDDTILNIFDLSALAVDDSINTILGTMTGKEDATRLQITFSRLGGHASDDYGGTADIYTPYLR